MSSSSQALAVKEQRRDRERRNSKGLSPDRNTGRRRGIEGDMWKGTGGIEFFMKGGGSRPGV